MNRCFGAPFSELPVVEALSFLDRTESARFLHDYVFAMSIKNRAQGNLDSGYHPLVDMG